MSAFQWNWFDEKFHLRCGTCTQCVKMKGSLSPKNKLFSNLFTKKCCFYEIVPKKCDARPIHFASFTQRNFSIFLWEKLLNVNSVLGLPDQPKSISRKINAAGTPLDIHAPQQIWFHVKWQKVGLEFIKQAIWRKN